jgi:subtilisin family serine protease
MTADVVRKEKPSERVSGSRNLRRRNPGITLPVAEFLELRQMLTANPTPVHSQEELLIQFADTSNVARQNARSQIQATLIETLQPRSLQQPGYGVMERVVLPAGISTSTAISRLSALSGVIFAEPNIRLTSAEISNDPSYSSGNSLWGMYGDDQPSAVGPVGTTNLYGTQAEKVWNNGIIGSSSVYVGIVDTGVQVNHPDLIDNIWVNPFETAGDGIDNDGNGYVDDIHGWDFFNNDSSVYDSADGDVHGTHVAGTIGARGGNSVGVVGVNWNVTMVVTKFIGPNGGYLSDAVRALDYLTDLKVRHGLNVVASNNSWGGGGYSVGLHDAILRAAKANILFVAAAGNSSLNNDRSGSFPANFSTTTGTASENAAPYDSVISVAAIASDGNLASFSNYGATTVDLGAPGVQILSTVPNGYGYLSGTSMAAPHVTGAVALYTSRYPNATPAEIRRGILDSTTATTSLSTRTVTKGRLNVASAITRSPAPKITISDVQVDEGSLAATTATFTVNLSVASAVPVTVRFASAFGTASKKDFTAVKGTITFSPGETSKTIPVTIVGDTIVEGPETFRINLTNAVNAALERSSAVGTIRDNDALAVVTVTDISATESNSGKKPFQFTLRLSHAMAETVKVLWTTAPGTAGSSDFKVGKGTATFSPGATTQTVNILVNGDSLPETNEVFTLNLMTPVNAGLERTAATATIVDDDGGNSQSRVSGKSLAASVSSGRGLAGSPSSPVAAVTSSSGVSITGFQSSAATPRDNAALSPVPSSRSTTVSSPGLRPVQSLFLPVSGFRPTSITDREIDLLFTELLLSGVPW